MDVKLQPCHLEDKDAVDTPEDVPSFIRWLRLQPPQSVCSRISSVLGGVLIEGERRGSFDACDFTSLSGT